jgi:hypothetical protein
MTARDKGRPVLASWMEESSAGFRLCGFGFNLRGPKNCGVF